MSNGRYDVIRPSSVNITPAEDWETVALKTFDKAEDRRAKEESEVRAQGNLDDARAEDKRRYEEQKAQEKEIRNRDEWQLMYDGAKDFNQKAMVYQAGLNAGVSGLTPEMHDSVKTRAMEEEQGKELLNKYYSSNDADKINMYPEVRSHLIKSGNQTDRVLLNSLEQDNKTRKATQGNQQVAELIVSQYPDVFTPATKSFIEGASTLSPESVKMFGTMVTSHIKNTTENYMAGMEAAMELINREEPGIDATDEDRLRHRALIQMGLSMKAELEGRGRTEDEETRTVPYPKLGIIDEDITGKDNTFDAKSDERKSSEFKRTLEQVIPGGEEAWKNMDRDTKAEKGQEIINIINQKSYTKPPDIKIGGFGVFTDPEFEGEESITDKAVNERYELILKKKGITGKRREMATKQTLDSNKEQARRELEREMIKKSKSKLSKLKVESFYDPEEIGGA